MSIDKYFSCEYKQLTYNCAHFVCDVWKDLTGVDARVILQGFLVPPSFREAKLSDLRKIKVLEQPENPCIVLFQNKWHEPHVGVYVHGRVLHLEKCKGVQFMPLSVVSLGYHEVRYIKC